MKVPWTNKRINVFPLNHAARLWLARHSSYLWACRTPLTGVNSPISSLRMVDLPAPFSPTWRQTQHDSMSVRSKDVRVSLIGGSKRWHVRCRCGTRGQLTGWVQRRAAGLQSNKTQLHLTAGWEETTSQSYLETCDIKAHQSINDQSLTSYIQSIN